MRRHLRLESMVALVLAALAFQACSSSSGGGNVPALRAPAPPKVLGVLPKAGPVEGGTTVVITGEGFRDDPTDPDNIEVFFGLNKCSNVLLLSTTELRVLTPPGQEGTVDVKVVNDDGKAGVLPGAFTYEKTTAPVLDSIHPAQGPNYGLTKVTLKGKNFKPGAKVRFGGSPSWVVEVKDSNTITAVTPYGPPGAVNVQVENPDHKVGTLPSGFTYQDFFRIEGTSFESQLDRPNPGRTSHPINVPITVRFNRPLEPGSVTPLSFSLKTTDGKPASGRVSVQGEKIVFSPDVKFVNGKVQFGFIKGATYVLTIPGVAQGSAVRAVGGEPLHRGFTWELNTNLDPIDFNNSPPKMSLKVPVIHDPKKDKARLDTIIVLQFDEIVMPNEVIDPANITFEVEVPGYSQRLPLEGRREAGVDLETGGTYLRFTPSRLLPSLSKVWITANPKKIHDVVGKELDPSTAVLSFLTEDGAGYRASVVEKFADQAHLDKDGSGALWGGGSLKPGRLGGSGLLGDLEVKSGTMILNTDNQVFDASRTLTGKSITVQDGVFRFSRLFVAAGATLKLTGSHPARILVRGVCRIEGKVDLSGQDGPVTDGSSGIRTGGAGGKGGPGGAAGGKGGSQTNFGVVDGGNGGDLLVPPGHPRASQASGTGGKGSPAHPAGADPKKVAYHWYSSMSQQVAGGGGGGGFMVAGSGGSSKVNLAPYSDAGPGGSGGKAFPLLPLSTTTASSLQLLVGGSGGGGAGIHPAGSYTGMTPQWHVGAGGGGGGGALLLQAGGDLSLGTGGSILSKGGAGGKPKAGTDASPGGGGSGGSVLLQVQGAVKLQGRVDVSGGAGASNTGSYLGYKSYSGAGAPGFIRLEHDPVIPYTSLTGFVPAAGKDNTGLLQEKWPVTGVESTWYNTMQVKVKWLHFEVKVKEGAKVVTYSDDSSLGTLPVLGSTPVAFFLQGTRLDQAGKPGALSRWVEKAADLNSFSPSPLAIRFILVLDTSKLPSGQDMEVQEVKVVYNL